MESLRRGRCGAIFSSLGAKGRGWVPGHTRVPLLVFRMDYEAVLSVREVG